MTTMTHYSFTDGETPIAAWQANIPPDRHEHLAISLQELAKQNQLTFRKATYHPTEPQIGFELAKKNVLSIARQLL
jgi:hypothetical protein